MSKLKKIGYNTICLACTYKFPGHWTGKGGDKYIHGIKRDNIIFTCTHNNNDDFARITIVNSDGEELIVQDPYGNEYTNMLDGPWWPKIIRVYKTIEEELKEYKRKEQEYFENIDKQREQERLDKIKRFKEEWSNE